MEVPEAGGDGAHAQAEVVDSNIAVVELQPAGSDLSGQILQLSDGIQLQILPNPRPGGPTPISGQQNIVRHLSQPQMKSPGVDKSEKAEDTTNLQRCIIMPENIEEEDIRVHFPNVDIKRPPFPLTKNSRPLSDMKERRKANYVILTFPNEEAAKNVKSEIVIKQTKIEVRDRNPPQMGHAMLEFLQIVKPPLEFSSLYQLRKTGCRLKCVCGFDLAVSSIKEHLTKYHDMKFKTNDDLWWKEEILGKMEVAGFNDVEVVRKPTQYNNIEVRDDFCGKSVITRLLNRIMPESTPKTTYTKKP